MTKQALVRLSDERIVTIKGTIEFPANAECEWREVPDIATQSDTFVDGVFTPYSAPVPGPLSPEQLVEAVQNEAERRIDQGILVAGIGRIRCDHKSTSRLHGMKDTPALAFPVKFKTQAGVDVTISSPAEAQAVFDLAATYVAAVLGASALLQDNPPNDFVDDSYWPSDAGY